MEPSESESVGSSTTKDPQLGPQCENSSPFPNDHHDPQQSEPDLSENLGLQDETRDELGAEFHDKLDLKEEDERVAETEKKDSNFEDGSREFGGEEVGGESGCAPESGEAQGSDDHDGWNDDEGYGWNDNVKESEVDKVGGDFDGDGNNDDDDDGGGVEVEVEGDDEEVEKKKDRSSGRVQQQQYPLRPDAEDCAFYLKTGTCKFGFNCKFNHPLGRRKNQVLKEKVGGEREEPGEKSGQIECKFYLRSGGCKFGKACKFNHTRAKSSAAAAAPLLELNFLGLPVRLGEKQCPYYMRTGSCKFGANCKFNHPDPTSGGGVGDSVSGFGNGSYVSLQGAPQPAPSWSSSKPLNETTTFVPIMLPPNQAVSPRSPEWNRYQAPVYQHPPSAYIMNNSTIETAMYMHQPKQAPVEEFPERPGEPECSYFLKTGDCKFKSNCKFHHPKNRGARLPPTLSDKGLPLRPDQNICSHYSRYGICKFGPACRFDHPTNPSPPSSPGFDQQTSYADTATELTAMEGNGDANDDALRQHV
ncbi:hypothetical protein PIB30_075576 [Stylosanthes scabra]|uniref:C3H1-type domain-containing protein n=1 Tax=Stylosanthes scabra TaxID=79078 RepID=A0ABU6TPK6_9FABA|nr:hypothetical protein [Stylosanthes scabra]